eukprot:2303263-Rhodomonas_salina.1
MSKGGGDGGCARQARKQRQRLPNRDRDSRPPQSHHADKRQRQRPRRRETVTGQTERRGQ